MAEYQELMRDQPDSQRPEPLSMNTTSEHITSSSPENGAHQELNQEPRSALWHRKSTVIVALSIVAIFMHLLLRFGFHTTPGTYQIPLIATLVLGGLPLLYDLLRELLKREFGSDLLGGISIITSILLGEYLAGSIIVLLSPA
jgi:cation transport ATPase